MNEGFKATLKSSETEDWLDLHVVRPFCYYLAVFFAKFDVHPNTVTIWSMIIGAASAIFFGCASWYYGGTMGLLYNIIAIAMLIVADIFDCTDGQLARMTGKKSQLGRILDGVAGFTWFIPIYHLMVYRFYLHHDIEFQWLGIADTEQNVLIATAVVYALGLIRYAGSFDILWKKQQFRGLMNTEKGNVNFDFEIDGKDKYLTGNVSTDSLHLGELFQLKQISDIGCSAKFKIDISKPRTALMRREKGGKLPIGHVEADIKKVGYRMIHMKNIVANIESDGAIANGDVTLKGSLTNLILQFSFTNTDEMHKMKVKPRLSFEHNKDKKD